MIKNYWEINLRDYDIMEKTGNVSRFKSKWNILPVMFFPKKIEALIKTLSEKLNESGTSEDKKLNKAIWQFESLNKIK